MSLFEELKRRNVFRVGLAYGVVAWLAVQIADVMIDNIGAPEWLFGTLLLVLAIGFPVVLVIAWAFELTPEGIKREREVDRQASITRKTGRKLDRAIIVMLAVAVGYLLIDKLVLQDRGAAQTADVELTSTPAVGEPAPPTTDPSVAVLPFLNMSGDPENEYFSDGLTDTLLHMLAQLPDLRVAARTSSFSFKGKDPTVEEVASALNVEHILEGSVQRAGGQVRVIAQLIRADDGFHVWSQNYTRPLEDIFAIQDEIATDVASALGASLGVAGEPSMQGINTDDLDAYDHYLHGLEQQAIASYPSLEAAEDSFQQALIQDATFTDARMALIRNYFMKRLTGILTDEQLQQVARPLLDQVAREDPDNRSAPMFEFMLAGRFSDGPSFTREEMQERLGELREMLAREPTDSFMRAEIAGGFSGVLDDHEAALEILEAGLLIDPLEPELYLRSAQVRMQLEDYEEAERALLRAIELRPEMPTGYGVMSILKTQTGDYPAALDWMRRAIERDIQDHELPERMAWEFYSLDMPEEAERWYAKVQALAPGSAVARALEVERAYVRGESERAIELAWRAIEDRIDNRGGAHSSVVFTFGELMIDQERAREAFEKVGAFRPETQQWDEVMPDGRGRSLQRLSFYLYSEFASPEDRLAAWTEMSRLRDAMGYPWRQPGDWSLTVDALVRGDIDTAVENEIEHRLSRPIARSPRIHRAVPGAMFQPLYDDPRMIAAVAQREREYQAVRAEVQEMLQREEWTTP